MTLDEKIRLELTTTRKLSRIYRIITGAVFTVLIVAGMVVWIMQFNHNVRQKKRDITQMLSDRGSAMNNVLETSYYRVLATRDWIEDYMEYGHQSRRRDMVTLLKQEPGLGFYFCDSQGEPTVRDKDETRFWGGLYGFGTLDKLEKEHKRHVELDMAMHLYELKRSQHKFLNRYFLWFMYISKNDFLTAGGLPALTVDFHRAFMNSNVKILMQKLYDNRFYWKDVLPENNPKREIIWNRLDGIRASGLMVTISAPVYNEDEFLGAYVCRLSPAILEKFTSNPELYENGDVILMNQYDQIICSSLHSDWREIDINTFQDEIIDLSNLTSYDNVDKEKQHQLAKSVAGKLAGEIQRANEQATNFPVNGYYVFTQPLKDIPWRFVYVVPRKSVWLAAMGIQEYFFLPLIIVALLLVMIVPHIVFRRYFVKPVIELVRFMRVSSIRRNVTVPNVPEAWKPWFNEIAQLPHLQNIAHSMPGALFQVKLAEERGQSELGFISESLANMLDERIESILENLRTDILYYFDESEREKLLKESRRILSHGGNLDTQCRLTTSKGRIRWLRIMGTPRIDENGETILEGILLDYTEQNETGRIINEQQSILQMLTEATIEGVFVHDDEIIIQANQALADCSGSTGSRISSAEV